MLSTILSFLGLLPKAFDTVNNITNAIANEKIAGMQATTQQDKIASDERVSALNNQMQVLLADSKISSIDLWLRTAIASGPAFILCKIFFYDKALGWGTTEISSGDPLWNVIMVVLGFYFLHTLVK